MPFLKQIKLLSVTAVFCGITAVAGVGPATAHGPGGHGDNAFTALKAAEKGMALYNRLIAEGRLDETWETGLATVHVSRRGAEPAMEFVVRFDRKEGTPESVYIFFDREGKYVGSNFTGE